MALFSSCEVTTDPVLRPCLIEHLGFTTPVTEVTEDGQGLVTSSWDEAHALAGLGRCALAAGDTTRAEILLRQAQEIFQRIDAADARTVLAELNALTGPQPAE